MRSRQHLTYAWKLNNFRLHLFKALGEFRFAVVWQEAEVQVPQEDHLVQLLPLVRLLLVFGVVVMLGAEAPVALADAWDGCRALVDGQADPGVRHDERALDEQAALACLWLSACMYAYFTACVCGM